MMRDRWRGVVRVLACGLVLVAVVVGIQPRQQAAACSGRSSCRPKICSRADGIAIGHAVPAPKEGDISRVVLDTILRTPKDSSFTVGASFPSSVRFGQLVVYF